MTQKDDIPADKLTKEEKDFIKLYSRASINDPAKTYVQPIASYGWNAAVREAMEWIESKNRDSKFAHTIVPKGFYLQLHKKNSLLLSYERIPKEKDTGDEDKN